MRHMIKRDVVRKLRARGLSYGEMSDILGAAIPKGTFSSWCHGVEMGERERKNLRARQMEKLADARAASLRSRSASRARFLSGLREKNAAARTELLRPMSAKMVLAALYLGEGGKNAKKARVSFGNSDAGIIRLFLKLLRSSFALDEGKFRCTVLLRADQDAEAIQAFWSGLTGIPRSQFYAPRVDSRTIGKATLKKGYMGVCVLDYFSSLVFNELAQLGHLLTDEGR